MLSSVNLPGGVQVCTRHYSIWGLADVGARGAKSRAMSSKCAHSSKKATYWSPRSRLSSRMVQCPFTLAPSSMERSAEPHPSFYSSLDVASFQLRNGQLVVVPPILVRRLKSHFIALPCNVDLILGLNGYIWVSKHVQQKHQEGEEGFDAEAVYSSQNDVGDSSPARTHTPLTVSSTSTTRR
jgi:hypothetical protein